MKRLMITLVALAAFASACGSNSTTSTAEAQPTTTAAETTAIEPEVAPQRIVSLSPTATEILFAIGAGDQVIAVDSLSNYPADAPLTDLSAFEPNIEAISGYEPDLIVVSYAPGDLIDGLSAIGIDGMIQGSAITIADTYDQILELGSATGHVRESNDLIEQLKSELEDLVASAPDGSGVTYFHEIDDTLYTATSSTFIGEIYSLFGLENIADPADADGGAFGYPQLSNEYIIDADPDLIFLSDSLYSGQDADMVAARPGWDTISAVADGNIVALDDDIASRWSPRIVQLAESIAAALAKVTAPA